LGLGFFCTKIYGQAITIEGVVKDSAGNGLELANVIALLKDSEGISSYGITDSDGRFRLKLQTDSIYTIRASYLGYADWEKIVSFKKNDSRSLEIVMKAAPNQLDGIELVQELPISVSGDTITYKTDAFNTGRERKLEDVLENLPGFEIDDDGQVKVQGKSVSKVLVEGKEFFDGDSKLATQNIPANAVDKVQVLRNFNDVSPLRSVNNSDAIALNVKLKEGKKNLLFGDVEAGYGLDERNLVHPNLFYYSPKASVNFIGDLNNIGQQAFTLQDYFRFNGGLQNLANRSGSSTRLTSDDIGISLLQNNRALNIDTKLGALNFSYNPNKKWSFSGFAIASAIETDLQSNSFRTYLRELGNLEENLNSETFQDNATGLLKFTSTYTPNSNLHVSFQSYLRAADLDQNSLSVSNFSAVANTINSDFVQSPFSVEQRLSAFYTANENNIFSFEANYLYKDQDAQYNLQTTEVPFNGLVDASSGSPFQLIQDRRVFTNKADAVLNYYYVLNKKNHINFSVGANYLHQNQTSGIAQGFSGSSNVSLMDPVFNNLVAYHFLDSFIGLQFRTKLGKLTLSPALNLHFYDLVDTQLGIRNEQQKTLLLPKFNARYKIKSSSSLTLDYGIEAQFPDIQPRALGTIIRSYNALFSGNRGLENSWFHQVNVNFFEFNSFNFTNISAGLNYQRKLDEVINNLNFQGINRTLSPINVDAVNETLSGFGNYQKRFALLKLKAETRLSYATYVNFIDAFENDNQSFTQNYKGSLESNFKKGINFELGFEKIVNNYKGNNSESIFVTNRPFANLEVSFLKNFTLTADYEYNDYFSRDGNAESTYDFLNTNLYYQKEGSKWEFKLSGLNLLDTTEIRQDSFSNSLISTQRYFVQPRYFLFSIKHNL